MNAILRTAIASVFLAGASFAQTFTDVSSIVPNLSQGKAAWHDYDGDGFIDLHTVGIPGPDKGRIWRNNGGVNFTQQFSNIGEVGLWADYNNDGFPDFLSYAGPANDEKQLHRNSSAASFTQVGLPPLPTTNSRGASWADHNNDGDLDLYLGGFENSSSTAYFADVILTNNGGTSFTHTWTQGNDAVVSPGQPRPGRGITSSDFDRDGDVDIYISNYRLEPNQLRVNDGNGNFTDEAVARGVEGDNISGVYGHTIGSAWGDFNNDGEMDLFVGNFAHAGAEQDRSKFYENLGQGGGFNFLDHGTLGLPYMESYSSPTLGDIDNDGDLDLFMTTTNLVQTGLGPNPGLAERGVLFRNDGNWSFTEITDSAGLGAITDTDQSGFADYDNDGDLDLLTDGRLYRNNHSGNHWLKVKLVGDGQQVNRDAVGAQVRIQVGNETYLRDVQFGTGEGNMNDPTLHFGLGSTTSPVTLDILWPGGVTQQVTGAAVDQTHTVNFALPEFDFEYGSIAFGDWFTSSNWTPTGVPNANSDNALLTGSTLATTVITLGGSAIVNKIEMNGDSEYRVVGVGNLNLSGQQNPAQFNVTGGDGHRVGTTVRAQTDATLSIDSGASVTFAGVFEFSGATVTKDGAGTVVVDGDEMAGSGTFELTDGTVMGHGFVNGDLNATGGTVAPGNSIGRLDITGDFTLGGGATLQLEISGAASNDLLALDGNAFLSGGINVQLLGGYEPAVNESFLVMTASQIFDNGLTLTGPNAADFKFNIFGNTAVLKRIAAAPGDYNGNGIVDVADYTTWLDSFGQSGPGLAADGNGDMTVDQADYLFWKNAFTSPGTGRVVSVPEPSAICLLLVVFVHVASVRHRYSHS